MADEGQSGGNKIARLAKGDKTRTARHAEVMNEIIDAVNSLRSIKVSPQEIGKFTFADANAILELKFEKLSLQVCIDGEVQTKTFLVVTS